jgi:NAD-dependent oxidoreductase involved in siderophore biosynthesis
MSSDSADAPTLVASESAHLDVPTATVLGPADAPSQREVLSTVWPAAVARALGELAGAVRRGEDPRRRGQYHLALCRLVSDLSEAVGAPVLIRGRPPDALDVTSLVPAVESDRAALV